MNTFKRFTKSVLGQLIAVLSITALLFLPTLPASAGLGGGGAVESQFDRMYSGSPVSGAVGAVQTGDVFMVVKYVGANHGGGACGKVAVAAGGGITFTSGACGAEAADTTLECPVSPPLGGIIDVTNAACDTMGEVVDIINASANWRAVLVDALRSDSSNDTLFTQSAIAANSPAGVPLYHDNTVDFTVTTAMIPLEARDMRYYLEGGRLDNLLRNPWSGNRAMARIATGKTTFGSGTSSWNIYSCLEYYSTVANQSSETCTTLYSTAAGNTTVANTLDFSAGGGGFLGRKDEKLLVRVTNSAAMTAATLYSYGVFWPYR